MPLKNKKPHLTLIAYLKDRKQQLTLQALVKEATKLLASKYNKSNFLKKTIVKYIKWQKRRL